MHITKDRLLPSQPISGQLSNLRSLCLRTGLVTCALAALTTTAAAKDLPREVSGWYNDGWNAESHASYMANTHLFSEINPYWYDLGTQEDVTLTDGTISEREYAYTAQNVVDAHAYGDLVIPTIADHEVGQINDILANSTARQDLIDNIVAVVASRGYDGIDLNFELGTSSGRAAFTAFVDDLADTLHGDGKRLVVTINGFTSQTEENGKIFDYAGLAATSVDRLRIMAYDNNFEAGANVPGPIAPIDWIEDVLDYAITTRGVPSDKIQLALHNYAWSWKQSGSAWQLQTPHDTYEEVVDKSGSAVWQWNSSAEESYKQYTYNGNTYISYVGTADTVAARIALADTYDLAGISFWVLGREDEDVYTELCSYHGSACVPDAPLPSLLSQGKTATASSKYSTYYNAPKAVDGTFNEGWIAKPSAATAWLQVDLGAAHSVSQVKIQWGGYDWSVNYDVQVSSDGTSWTTAQHVSGNNDGGLDTVNITPTSARYVRVNCTGPKSDGWSYEIYEFQVFGI